MQNKSVLPDKPSELIRVALADLEKVESMTGYKIAMSEWHSPMGDTCYVCLAGAVMVCDLGAGFDEYLRPKHYDWPERSKLQAINALRDGAIRVALCIMSLTAPKGLLLSVPITHYNTDHKQFKSNMLALADYLETFNL